MALNLTNVRNLVGSVLNATRSSYGDFATKADPLHPTGEIDEAILAAGRGVMGVIFDTPGHRLRDAIMELRTVANGDLVASGIGAVLIDGAEGTYKKPSQFRRLKTNTNAIASYSTSGFYTLQSKIISFLGSSCKVETTKALTSANFDSFPEEYEYAVIAGALAITFNKMGTNETSSGQWNQAYQAYLGMIRQGAVSLPAQVGQTAIPRGA
jgi:hypothetical protein